MSLANFFIVTSFGGFFIFPLFITGHGGSHSDIGIIMGVFALSSVLCRPWISELVDHIGRRRSYTIGCTIMSFLPLAYILFKGTLTDFYVPLLFVRILHGVGLAFCFTACFTYIADIVPEDRLNEGIGMFGSTGLVGLAIGPAFAEIIIKGYGFTTFFVSSASLAAIGLFLQWRLPESYTNTSHDSTMSFFSVLFRRKTILVATLAALFGFALSASGGFVSPFAERKNIFFISLYYLSYSFAAILTRLLGGRFADRIGEDRIIPYALVLTGIGFIMLIFLGGNAILVISGLLTGCGHGFLFPCLNALAIRDEPISVRGKINGVFTGGIDGGAFVGSIALGYVGEWAGFEALFFAAALALFLGLGVLRFRI